MRIAIGVVVAALGSVPAAAQGMDSFRSPSGNIGCSHFEGFLRCDLLEVSSRLPARPADCGLDWGKAFWMETTSLQAGRMCHGDIAVDPEAPVLPYGALWESGGFSCLSSRRGMSCRNAHGAGWDLSRAKQTVY